MSEPKHRSTPVATQADSRFVYCLDCPKTWRYGCAACAELFANHHRKEFDHQVTVQFPWNETPPKRRRKSWWER